MKIKSERDFWSGLMFIVVGVSFAIGATNYSMGTAARPGAGYFPLGLSVIMAVIGAVILFKSLTIESPGGDRVGSIAFRPLLVIIASILVFGFTIEYLGMLIAIPILIFMVSFAGDEFGLKGVLAAAVVLTIFSWIVFVYGLKLTIPVFPAFVQ